MTTSYISMSLTMFSTSSQHLYTPWSIFVTSLTTKFFACRPNLVSFVFLIGPRNNISSRFIHFICKGPLTIKSVISPIVGIKFLVIPFAMDVAFKMYIKEESFQHSMNKVNYKLAYQPVCYYGLKRVGFRDLEEYNNGLSAHISHQVVLYYDNIVLLRYNKWKVSDNTHQLDNWIKLIHV